MPDKDVRGFEVVCEIAPPASADLDGVGDQVAALVGVCDAFLVPDNHLGRATVSSIAVAHEVGRLGGRAIASLNARDRNLLGLRRDLLTAGAYGVDELLFVYGDAPSDGERSALTVRRMLAEVDALESTDRDEANAPSRVGVAADVRKDLPDWKRGADFACTQLTFDAAGVSRWRRESGFAGRVYAGVIVLASERMADRLTETIPGFTVPEAILARLRDDPSAGVEVAVEQVAELREHGEVDGVQLVAAGRHRRLADALERASPRPS